VPVLSPINTRAFNSSKMAFNPFFAEPWPLEIEKSLRLVFCSGDNLRD